MQLSRRQILIGTLAGGGLAVGYMLRPRSFPLPLAAGRDEVAFDAWIKIATDGTVAVAVPQLEMGQGITTLTLGWALRATGKRCGAGRATIPYMSANQSSTGRRPT